MIFIKKNLLYILIFIVALFSLLATLNKILIERDTSYSALMVENSSVCFLYDDKYSFQVKDGILLYKAGKNSGQIQLFLGSLDPSYQKIHSKFFPMSIRKKVNDRYLQYQISDTVVMIDKFNYAKKEPSNLIPRTKQFCKSIKSLKKVSEIELKTFDSKPNWL